MSEMNETKSNRPETGGNSAYNALDFAVRQIVRSSVSTAIPVKVTAVYAGGAGQPAGYVDVLPLVSEIDARGGTIAPATLYRLPYSRAQGGIAAIVIDPREGDIGLAVFAERDSSNVAAGTTSPVQPGSYRRYDEADGFYVGGFLNAAPSCYIELRQDGVVNIKAAGGVNIETPKVTVTGDVVSGGISYLGHTHTGVHGETSTPH